MFFRRKNKGRSDDTPTLRRRMVNRDLRGRDIEDERILSAMAEVPRELFLPPDKRHLAYEDHAVPIGYQQTISQPYIVALTLQMAELRQSDNVLEIGAGSGYATAVLARLVTTFTSLEIIAPLAHLAQARLSELGVSNGRVHTADASFGFQNAGPYDAIVSAAAPKTIPEALLAQLAPGGRLVCPVGAWHQTLCRVRKTMTGELIHERGIAVRFVPMTGAAQRAEI